MNEGNAELVERLLLDVRLRRDDVRGAGAVSMLFRDLRNSFWIKLKGALFLFGGFLASTLLLIEHPTLKAALLLMAAIWCFCRCYYFAFYVIERYIDADFRFCGLLSCAKFLFTGGKERIRPSFDP
ncbi:MAG: hypothetical protein ABSC76_07755 [Terracidiphilus sp.]